MRSSVRWSNTRAAITAHMPAIVRATSSTDSRVSSPTSSAAHVDRVPAERLRPPSRSRCGVRADGFSNSAATPWPASTGGTRAGIGLPRDRPVEQRRERAGTEVVDLEERSAHACSALGGAAPAAMIATASSISASVTSSGGASRSALAVTAFSTRPASRHALGDGLGVETGRELGRDQEPGAAHVGDAVDLLEALGEPGARARGRASGTSLALHHGERRERGARGERLAAEGRRVVAGRERRRRRRRAPSTRRSACRCRAPSPS